MLEFVSRHPDFEGAELQRKDFRKGCIKQNSIINLHEKNTFQLVLQLSQLHNICLHVMSLKESCGRKAKVATDTEPCSHINAYMPVLH